MGQYLKSPTRPWLYAREDFDQHYPQSPGASVATSFSILSFNGRTGAVTLTGADVVAALGFAPEAANGPAIVSDATLAAGMPVAVSRSTNHLVKADAASKPIAFVAGLLAAAVTATFAGTVESEEMTLSDWTAVTGTTALSPGQVYFLAAGGGLTTTPPSSPDCITIVGEAASPTTLLIRPQPPIQL